MRVCLTDLLHSPLARRSSLCGATSNRTPGMSGQSPIRADAGPVQGTGQVTELERHQPPDRPRILNSDGRPQFSVGAASHLPSACCCRAPTRPRRGPVSLAPTPSAPPCRYLAPQSGRHASGACCLPRHSCQPSLIRPMPNHGWPSASGRPASSPLGSSPIRRESTLRRHHSAPARSSMSA